MTAACDRRQITRLPVEIPVAYLGNEFLGGGTVINLSPHGVLIRGDYIPVVGTNLLLRMLHPGDKEPIYIERGVLRWQREAQLGVEIMSMTPETHVRLIGIMTLALQYCGCVCGTKLPWHCRCFPATSCGQRSTET